jgi:hypothetical protein
MLRSECVLVVDVTRQPRWFALLTLPSRKDGDYPFGSFNPPESPAIEALRVTPLVKS